MQAAKAETPWREGLYDVLKEVGVRQVVYVPDAGHATLIKQCHDDPEMKTGYLTNEFEGVGVCAGAWLGGERAVMLMQSSGVGNIINALGLVRSCGIPFFTIVTMRGEWGEFNTWQIPMGRTTEAHLELCGLVCYRCDTPDSVGDTVRAGIRYAYNTNSAVAVLLGQRLIGAKVFEAGRPEGTR